MKRIILAGLALSMAYAPMANAQSFRPDQNNRGIERQFSQPRHVAPRQFNRGPVAGRHVDRQPRWTRGHRVPNWQRQQAVQDWKRHGLRKPGRNQRWVRVGNEYLLIGALTGIIASIIASR
jgi:Ni/Co efflux regulator RcnB